VATGRAVSVPPALAHAGPAGRLLSLNQILGLADQAVVSGATFFATIAVGRWVNASQLGTYSLGMSILFVLVAIQRSLVCLPFTVRLHKLGHDGASLGAHALVQSGALGGAATVSLLLVALTLLADGADGRIVRLAIALAWLAPLMLLREFARQFEFAHLRVAQAFVMDSAVLGMQAGGLLWLRNTGQLSTASVCLSAAAAFGLAAIMWLYLSHAEFRFDGLQLGKDVRQNWGLGGWLLASQIAAAVQGFAAAWLLMLLDSTRAAGIYAACLTLVSIASPLINGSANVLMPRMALVLRWHGPAALRQQAVRDAAVLGAMLAAFCMVATFTAGIAMRLLYRDYPGQEDTIRILSLGLLATAIGIPAANALACLERPRALFWASLVGAAANLLWGASLISRWGVLGGAYGFLAGSMVGMIARWAVFLVPAQPGSTQDQSAAAQVADVLRQVHAPSAAPPWTARLLGAGAQSVVFAANPSGRDPARDEGELLAVKLYRPPIARELAAEQFEAFKRLHAVLNGRHIGGWRLVVPQPLGLCETPLALVTTMVRGRTLLQQLEANEGHTGGNLASAARAVADGMMACWSHGVAYGDLNLDNILCDFESRTLSFLDPGTAVPPPSEEPPDGWRHAARDLAYLLFESVTTILHSLRHIGAESRKQDFVAEIMRHILRAIPTPSDQRLLLDEVSNCAGGYLAMLDAAWTPRGLWRAILRRIGRRRIEALLGSLRAELSVGGG
jgi:O-antigen/teichoic acid export membrane protein